MDFFIKSTTPALSSIEADHLAALGSILRTYELFVRTTCDDFEPASSLHHDMQDDNRTDSPSRTILTCVDEFTRATKQHGANLLRDPPKHFTQGLSVSALFARELSEIDNSHRRKFS